MRIAFLLGVLIFTALLAYFWMGSEESGETSGIPGARGDGGMVRLSGGGEVPASTRGEAVPRGALARRGGEVDALVYEKRVDNFIRSYRQTVNEANPLVHALLVHSRGGERMTEGETGELKERLSIMEGAPGSRAVRAYPAGYGDCAESMELGAVSLRLAARSVRRFSETADEEYLGDYRALIGMYLQAVSEARSCVSDHLYPAYP